MTNNMVHWYFIFCSWLISWGGNAGDIKSQPEASIEKTEVPVEINCDSGIICERDKNMCTAYGNVVVTHKEYKLNCDKLITHFRSTKSSKNELYKIEAIGHAIMNSPDKVIEAELLKAYVNKNATGKYEIDEIEAFNNVIIITQTEVAKAKYGHYQPEKHMMILKDNVQITNQEGQMNGAYAEVDLDKGISKMLMKFPTQEKDEKSEAATERVKVLILPKAQKTK
jgi:lipopolysaccharide export system protein LptA